MRHFLYSIILGVTLMLTGCSNSIQQYENTTPSMSIQEYFSGSIKAWGIVQDWRGRVVKRFDIKMQGSWDGNTGTLDETFDYYDGSTQKRRWTIYKKQDGYYEGQADDIIGTATGQEKGSAVRWGYTMEVPVGDTTYRLAFDDWMWLMNDGVVMNRSYLKKFGIPVAQLTIFMQKQ